MAFKENLLKKMKIDSMANKVLATLGPSDSGLKIDKETMREIFNVSPYKQKKERDLELYIQETDTDQKIIAVLDNELPIYKTTPEDVALRKSPTLKEMISIRNAVKIINDKDVKISRKEDSLKIIHKECIDLIDLSFERTDLDDIENDGVASLERGYTEGVIESISLFSEVLKYTKAPKPFRISHCMLFGEISKKKPDEKLFGPVVIYNMMHNALKFIDKPVSNIKEFEIKYLHDVAIGKEAPSIEGAPVFHHLKDEIIKRYL